MELRGIEESEFNSGLALIYQLDSIERNLTDATYIVDWRGQYRLLCAYFKVLCNQLSEKEQAEQIEMWGKVKKSFKQIDTAIRKGQKYVPDELLEIFDFWEIQLKNLKQKHGLGMPQKNARYSMK